MSPSPLGSIGLHKKTSRGEKGLPSAWVEALLGTPRQVGLLDKGVSAEQYDGLA